MLPYSPTNPQYDVDGPRNAFLHVSDSFIPGSGRLQKQIYSILVDEVDLLERSVVNRESQTQDSDERATESEMSRSG